MTRMQRAGRVKRWSAYQGGPPLSVPAGYRESHTVWWVAGGQRYPPKKTNKITPHQAGSFTSLEGGTQEDSPSPPTLGTLTFLQLVTHHPEEGHGDHEEVEEEAELAELPRRRPTHRPHDPLVGGLGAERRRVAQHRQPAHQEHQRALRGQEPARCTLSPLLGTPAQPTRSSLWWPQGKGRGRNTSTRAFGFRFGFLGHAGEQQPKLFFRLRLKA